MFFLNIMPSGNMYVSRFSKTFAQRLQKTQKKNLTSLSHKNHIYHHSICLRMSGGGSVWHGHEVMNNNIENRYCEISVQRTVLFGSQQWFTSVSHTRSRLCYFLLWDRKWTSHPGRGGKWVRDRDRLFIFYPITSQLRVLDTDVNHCCGLAELYG